MEKAVFIDIALVLGLWLYGQSTVLGIDVLLNNL